MLRKDVGTMKFWLALLGFKLMKPWMREQAKDGGVVDVVEIMLDLMEEVIGKEVRDWEYVGE